MRAGFLAAACLAAFAAGVSAQTADPRRPGLDPRPRHVPRGRARAPRRVLRALPQPAGRGRTEHGRPVGRRRSVPRGGPRRGPGTSRAAAAGRHDAAGRLAAPGPRGLRGADRVARDRAGPPRGPAPPAPRAPPPEPQRVRQRRAGSAGGRGGRRAASSRGRLEPGIRQPGRHVEPVAGPHRGLSVGGGPHRPAGRRQRRGPLPDRLSRGGGRDPELPR